MASKPDDFKMKMQLNFHSDDSFSPAPSPGGSLRETRRPRPSLGLPLDGPIGLSPVSRRVKGSFNLNAPLSREGLRFDNFPKPSQDEYERKLDEIMKLSGVLNIDGVRYPTPIMELEPIGDLGNGTCGHVVKMRHKESGKIIACKQMRRTGNSEETKRIVMDMDVVLKAHDCCEVVVCLGCFITTSDVWICMELMATCFDKLLKQIKAPVPENICGKIAVATLNALNYLKVNHGVIHRDVKPSNILLDYEGNVKLCDFGISGRLVDSKAKTRSAGCAAYMAPERINPPNPKNPDYDIRADVWSLGITLVELATGEFPYRDCKTEFEVLTKVIQEEPPCLPPHFSTEFKNFVKDCLLKNYKLRPKYKKLLEHPFIIKYRDTKVDVGAWYSRVSNHSGDPNKQGDNKGVKPVRKSSIETRNEPQVFKPQPSPRLPKSRRLQAGPVQNHSIDDPTKPDSLGASRNDDSSHTSALSSSFSRLNFYTKDASAAGSVSRPSDLDFQKSVSRINDEKYSRYGSESISPRSDYPARLQELSSEHGNKTGGASSISRQHHGETSPRGETSSRLNGAYSSSSRGVANFPSAFQNKTSSSSSSNYLVTSSSPSHSSHYPPQASSSSSRDAGAGSYHTTTSPTSYRSPSNSAAPYRSYASSSTTSAYHHYPSSSSYSSSRPNYYTSRSQEDYAASLRSKRTEVTSPRDHSASSSLRKYSYERSDSGKDATGSSAATNLYTPQASRKYYDNDSGPLRKIESPRKGDQRDSVRSDHVRGSGDSPLVGGAGASSRLELASPRKPGLPVPDPSINSSASATSRTSREPTSTGRTGFLPQGWKLSSWNLSSPISFRRFRTSTSTDRAATFDRRQHPTYRSLNERDKHFYTSSGRSDNF